MKAKPRYGDEPAAPPPAPILSTRCDCQDCEKFRRESEAQRMLDLREKQLAECRRVMREVADALLDCTSCDSCEVWPLHQELANKLSDTRAGKAAP